jgi:hypothetical protein
MNEKPQGERWCSMPHDPWCPQCKRELAEVETLREGLARYNAVWGNPDKAKEGRAEVERVRGQSAAFQEMNRKNGNTILEYRSDVKRLVAEVEKLRHEIELRETARMNNEREVERLREELTTFGAGQAILELEAEVERLRALVKRAASIFDDHIDTPQAVSHAELRATAKEFRNALTDQPTDDEVTGLGEVTPIQTDP